MKAKIGSVRSGLLKRSRDRLLAQPLIGETRAADSTTNNAVRP